MNPLLVAQLATRAREEFRRHPGRWTCVALLLTLGPGIGCILMVGLLILILGADPAASRPDKVSGIPDVMLAAYAKAATRTPALRPGCRGMRWSILAAIAQEESHHAAGHRIAANGDITPPILGPALDGTGTGGNHTPLRFGDGSVTRAVGPFQFLPSTWDTVAQDGNDDGVTNPQNAFDAALTAAVYLCGTGPVDLGRTDQLRAAILRYNHSPAYADAVLADIQQYDQHPGATPATGAAKAVIDAALSQLGTPYAWGGGTAAGPSRGIRDGGVADAHHDYDKTGFDCSGLTLFAYAHVGVALPHSSGGQFNTGTGIPRAAGLAALRPGDLVFYSPGLIHHVGIYLGENRFVNAPYSGTTVRIDTISPTEYAGGVRLLSS